MTDSYRSLRWLVAACIGLDVGEEFTVKLRRCYNWLTVQKVLPDQPGDARGEKRSKRLPWACKR